MTNYAKAIRICDYLIKSHNKNAKGIEELIKKSMNPNDGAGSLGMAIASTHRDVAKALELLKSFIEKPTCKHPKKMQDTCDGVLYCMDCNEDL